LGSRAREPSISSSPCRVRLDTASKRKYASLLGAVGDWAWFQRLLRTLAGIGQKHGGTSIANVASRWVLQRPAVGAIILGAHYYLLHVHLLAFQTIKVATKATAACKSRRWVLQRPAIIPGALLKEAVF